MANWTVFISGRHLLDCNLETSLHCAHKPPLINRLTLRPRVISRNRRPAWGYITHAGSHFVIAELNVLRQKTDVLSWSPESRSKSIRFRISLPSGSGQKSWKRSSISFPTHYFSKIRRASCRERDQI